MAPSAKLLTRFKKRNFDESSVRKAFFDAYEREFPGPRISRRPQAAVSAILRPPHELQMQRFIHLLINFTAFCLFCNGRIGLKDGFLVRTLPPR